MTDRFRPHHILCERFLNLDFPERGKGFAERKQKVIEIIRAHDDTLVEAIEGVDEICRVCPNCRGNRCASPDGEEEAVRKWDSIILRSLGIGCGETMTAMGWRTLIDDKAPLELCGSKCPHRLNVRWGRQEAGASLRELRGTLCEIEEGPQSQKRTCPQPSAVFQGHGTEGSALIIFIV